MSSVDDPLSRPIQTDTCSPHICSLSNDGKGHALQSSASTQSVVQDLPRPLPYNTVITRSNLFKLRQHCSVIPPILISMLRYGWETINC